MINISLQGNSVVIDTSQQQWVFPKGTIWCHANAGDNQSVDIRLAASRKTVLTFRYDQCNLAGQDAIETVENINNLESGENA